jgi:RimJ/RimL family protein N-acetyltransferase
MTLRIPPAVTHLEDGRVEISTPRLLLRGAREDDVAGLYEAFSDPEVMRYW